MDRLQWSEQQQKQINDWLTAKWSAKKQCPMCGHVAWSAGPTPTLLPRGANDSGDMVIGGGYPCVVVTCTNCGNTVLVNAIVAGVRNPSPSPAAQSESAGASDV